MYVYALNDKFQMVSTGIPYDNLQWNRKYYEAGSFSMQVPESVYDPSWKYVLTDERPEVGMVQRKETGSDNLVLISGFFCEKMLDRRAIFPKYVPMSLGVNPMTATDWAEGAFLSYKGDLPIRLGESSGVDDDLYTTAEDDRLGEKIYSVLQTVEASYRVRYDEGLVFEVWRGIDRTSSHAANGRQIFSTEFGNVRSRKTVTDDSDYYNYAIAPADADEDGLEREVIYVDLSNGEPTREIVIDMRSSSVDDSQTMEMWREAVRQEVTEKLLEYAKVEEYDISPYEGEYLTRYDIGDKCDILFNDIGIDVEARIIEVLEVFKADGGHEATMGFGNKRISNIRRAVNG